MLRTITVLIAASCLLFSCTERDKSGKPLDTITTGEITVAVEEGYKPVIASCIDVFDSIYRTAKINPRYVAEGEAVNLLLNDSLQVIIIGRQLNARELGYFQSRGFTPPVTPIAYDALGIILNNANPDSVLTVDQVKDMLTGKAGAWKDINPKSTLGNVQVVFDNPLSGTLNYVRDSIIPGQELSKQASALKTNEEVIAYVSKNKNAIGIIAANWISDTDDSGVQKFLNEVRIADIAKGPGEEGYGPYQYYLAANKYPFKRTMYIINAQARRNGLGAGFASYLARDGQRIILKDGLLPVGAVTRLVKTSR